MIKQTNKYYIHIIIPINHCFSLTLKDHTRYINMDLYLYDKKFLWWKWRSVELSIHTEYLDEPFYDGEYNTNESLSSNTKAIGDYIEMICRAYKRGIIDFEAAEIMIKYKVKKYNGKCITFK